MNYAVQDARIRPPLQPVLQLVDLRRTFKQGDREIPVLHGASAALYPGEAVALVGPSGAGKSTLLHIAGLLETPDGGQVIVNGYDCAQLGDADRTRMRRGTMGFVYQFHQLLPEFSALENVVIPQMIAGSSKRAAAQRAKELLEMMGLAPAARSPSGAAVGRRAAAHGDRACARQPAAPDPGRRADRQPRSGDVAHVFHELLELIQHTGVAALIATHNFDLARRMHRILRMQNGVLVEADPASIG